MLFSCHAVGRTVFTQQALASPAETRIIISIEMRYVSQLLRLLTEVLRCFFKYKWSLYSTSDYLNTWRRREETIERRWWEQKKSNEERRWGGSWWRLVFQWSDAPPHLPLPHPVCHSFNSPSHSPLPCAPLLNSHTARHKRQRGGNATPIKDLPLFLSVETQRIWKIFFLSSSRKDPQMLHVRLEDDLMKTQEEKRKCRVHLADFIDR